MPTENMPSENMPTCTGETHNNKSLALAFDWQEWLPYFEDQDIPEAQKREMIETLWQIVVAFVDLGFEVHPAQVVMDEKGCGQLADPLDQAGHTDSNEIKPVDECKTKDERASDDT